MTADNSAVVCTCGRTHSLSTQEIFLGEGALKKFPILLEEEGYSHPVIVCDGNTWKAAGKQTASLIPGSRVRLPSGRESAC